MSTERTIPLVVYKVRRDELDEVAERRRPDLPIVRMVHKRQLGEPAVKPPR